MPIRSPAWTPAATRPRARADTWSANCRLVTGSHRPPTLRLRATWSGVDVACSVTASGSAAVGGTWKAVGLEYSCTGAPVGGHGAVTWIANIQNDWSVC